MTTEPRIRIVVLTYDGGQMTIDCLTSIRALDWPSDRLEVVLVDNGSLDDVAERVRREFPEVVVLEPLANLGFAGGCNLGIRHGVEGSLAEHFDHVALINNDATIESTWLRSMVAAMEDADDIGGVASKMLFADRFHGLTINVDGVEASDPGRALGVCLSAVRINEARDDDRLRFDEGFHGPVDPGRAGEEGQPVEHQAGSGKGRRAGQLGQGAGCFKLHQVSGSSQGPHQRRPDGCDGDGCGGGGLPQRP
ncbi:MAG: glycosyltransferase, partial [Actinobacteria bacterium]|nr:glycosyltransferase [Actinomycetota bacterium]